MNTLPTVVVPKGFVSAILNAVIDPASTIPAEDENPNRVTSYGLSAKKLKRAQESTLKSYRDDMAKFIAGGGVVKVYNACVSGFETQPNVISTHTDISLPGEGVT